MGVRIKFLKTKEGCAMVQMGDALAVERGVSNLNNTTFFGSKMQLGFSKQAFLADVANPYQLPDGTPSFQDFMGSKTIGSSTQKWPPKIAFSHLPKSFISSIPHLVWRPIILKRSLPSMVRLSPNVSRCFHQKLRGPLVVLSSLRAYRTHWRAWSYATTSPWPTLTESSPTS